MGKGEIARDEQFLLFPQCFQKACFPEASKGVIVWEWVKSLRGESWYLARTCIWREPVFLRQLELGENLCFARTGM